MDTFPIIRCKDEAKHGEYRTKCAILEIYDQMAEVIKANSEWRICENLTMRFARTFAITNHPSILPRPTH